MLEKLPVDDYLEKIFSSLETHPSLILSASPGAGKTTRVPPFLSQKSQGKLIVLEPRRMAAVAAAHRIAQEQGWKVGHQVGYQVRFENKTSSETRLVFMTEALLARQMLADPELTGVETVILDEFHERSASVDMTLALLKELQFLGSKIKIVLMSATLQAQEISNYLRQAPVIEVPGKLFPLKISQQKESQKLRIDHFFFDKLIEKIKITLSRTKNDILVFLPGVGEIRQTQNRLENQSWALSCDILPLHGRLSLEEQRKVLTRSSRQRIILSTNVAESSVTVDGVDTVIDCGLEKVAVWDQRTDFSRLDIQRVSLASARQRAGRSARQKEGFCEQLWSPQDELSMPKDRTPEIQRIDLSEILLFLSHHGVRQFESFDWFQKPESLRLQSSFKKLIHLKAIDKEGQLTALGQKIIRWPLSPELGAVLARFESLGQSELGSQIVSCLQEPDFVNLNPEEHPEGLKLESDLAFRLDILNGRIHLDRKELNYSGLERVKESARALIAMTAANGSLKKSQPLFNDNQLRRELLKAWPHRLCRRREKTKRALSINGYGVQLSQQTFVRNSEYFLALSGVEGAMDNETLITSAIGFSKDEVLDILKDQVEMHEELDFVEDKEEILLCSQRRIGAISLEEPLYKRPSEEQLQDKLGQLLLQRWDKWIKENSSLESYFQRFQVLLCYQNVLPEKAQKALQEFSIATWKSESLKEASYGETSYKNLIKRDLRYFFNSRLPTELRQILEEEIPASLQVPSGKTHAINYEKPESPSMEVRLQEVFGWSQNPSLLFGKVRITLSLLAPNYRPVQITGDLNSFWKNAYNDVKKELRSRYPKHSWPENPLEATAVAGPRRRQ